MLTDIILRQIRDEHFDALCFGTLAQRNEVSADSLGRLLDECSIREIFCDLNLRPNGYTNESVKRCIEHATTLKLSDEEAPLLVELDVLRGVCFSSPREAIIEIFNRYPNIKRMLYTKGANGSEVHTRDTFTEIPALKTETVSTVGAGDSYGAAWLTAMLGGASYTDAAHLAAKVSAFVVSNQEAVPQYSLDQMIY